VEPGSYDFECALTRSGHVTRTATGLLPGDPQRTYLARLRVRGVVEKHAYEGGTPGPAQWYAGGTAAADGWNTYELAVDGTTTHYFLNAADYPEAERNSHIRVFALDYTVEIPVAGGSFLDLTGDTADIKEIKGSQLNGGSGELPGVPPATRDGQFLQVDCLATSTTDG
jgi:hypothetical protein